VTACVTPTPVNKAAGATRYTEREIAATIDDSCR
jgi:hypothetical protein